MRYAAFYGRYSCERQSEQSIEGQLNVCQQYADQNDLKIVETYIDRAMTGTNDHRPAFQKMLADCEKNVLWDIVLVYAIDRFGRNSIEIAVNKQKLKKNNKMLISATQRTSDNIDGTKNLDGILLENVYIGLAEYYSAELSQKIRRGLNESRLKGYFTGGIILFGYNTVNKKLVINEDEANIVRKIFQDYNNGISITRIIEELNETGVQNHGKPFNSNSIYRLLSNEKYIGIYNYKGQIFRNIYPPIINEDIFYTVLKKIENNKYGKHKPDVCYLLKEKLKCGYCGNNVSSDSGTSKNGSVMRYYKCNTKKKSKQFCPLNPIRKELIENIVVDTTLEILASQINISDLAEKLASLHRQRLEDASILNILQKEYSEVTRSINNILDNMENGIVSKSIQKRLEDLESKQSSLEEKIEREKIKEVAIPTKEEIATYLQKAVRKKPKGLIDLLIDKVIIYNDKVEIYYNYTDKEIPEGERPREFLFYSCIKSFVIDKHRLGISPITLSFRILLFI